jgi:hypothetical protein
MPAAGRAMLGRKGLSPSGNPALDKAAARTSPGMITWVDPHSNKHCASCAHFHRRHCMLFVQLQRARLNNPNFLGPKLPRGQRACSRYAPKDGPAFGSSPKSAEREDAMVSMRDRYPRTGIFTAADFDDIGEDGIDLTIKKLELDVVVGDKIRDVVWFEGDGRGLALNQTNAHAIEKLYGDSDKWPNKKLNLFLDRSVTFNNEIKPGVRVRAPKEDGDGPTPRLPAAIVPKRPPLKDDLDDSLDDFR